MINVHTVCDTYIKETDPDGRMYYVILSGKTGRYNRKRIPLGDIGIYKIENLINGKCYVGQSIYLQRYRLKHHENTLTNNKHRNKHLQAAFNKYGYDNFTFTVLLYCEPWELERYEQGMVDALQSDYNQCKECVTSTKGMIMPDEARQKMSKAHIGKPGRLHTDESKRRMAGTHIGKSPGNKGKKASEEVVAHISAAQQLRYATSAVSEETKRKMSASQKLRRLKERSIEEEKKLLGTVTSGG